MVLLGEEFAREYQVLDLLAVGGTSRAYLAESLPARKHVVVKVMRSDFADTEYGGRVEMAFQREAEALRALRHPSIPRLDAAGISPDGEPYLVLEHFSGVTLQEVFQRTKRLGCKQVFVFAQTIADILDAIHTAGFVHCDVAPANIIIPEESCALSFQRARLIDFSSVTKWDSVLCSARQRVILAGTPPYIAPEILVDNAAAPAADIYSFGVLIFEAAFGQPPQELLRGHELGFWTVTEDSAVSQNSHQIFIDFILRCLNQDPDRRPSSGGVAADLLRRILSYESPKP